MRMYETRPTTSPISTTLPFAGGKGGPDEFDGLGDQAAPQAVLCLVAHGRDQQVGELVVEAGGIDARGGLDVIDGDRLDFRRVDGDQRH